MKNPATPEQVMEGVMEISVAAPRGIIAEVPGKAMAALIAPNCIMVAIQPAPGIVHDYCLN
jgi:hypothetical protein